MKTNTTIFNSRNLKVKFCLLMFVVSFSFLKAQDTIDYGLNDPRNPRCPCHKFQKIADDEFKKLLASANKNTGRSNSDFIRQNSTANGGNFRVANGEHSSSGFANSNASVSSDAKHKKYFWGSKHRHKKRFKLSPKWRRAFDFKNWDILKRSRILNSCFHWT